MLPESTKFLTNNLPYTVLRLSTRAAFGVGLSSRHIARSLYSVATRPINRRGGEKMDD